MKMMVILAVLFVSLLMVTGAAFAGSCCLDACAKVTATDLTNPANSFVQDWSFCFGGINLVSVCALSGLNAVYLFEASLFDQGLNLQAISIASTSNDLGVYMTFHGHNNDAFNGIYYNGSDLYVIHGIAEDCP